MVDNSVLKRFGQSGLSVLFIIPLIVLIILSGVVPSFFSCPALATWIIVFCSVALFSVCIDLVFRHFTFGFRGLSFILHIIFNLFFIAWDIYGIYLLAGPGKICDFVDGWPKYNYVITAILVALDLLASLIFLVILFRALAMYLGRGKNVGSSLDTGNRTDTTTGAQIPAI